MFPLLSNKANRFLLSILFVLAPTAVVYGLLSLVGKARSGQAFSQIEFVKLLYPFGMGVLWLTLLVIAGVFAVIYRIDKLYINRLMKLNQEFTSLRIDPNNRIHPVRGELGLIAEGINDLAACLHESRNLLEQVFDFLPVAVVAFSAEGKKLMCNQAAAAMFHCQKTCKSSTCLKKQSDPDSPLGLLGKTLANGKALAEQDFKFDIPGGHKHLLVRTDVIKGTEQNQLAALLVAWDITERYHMQNQLRQAEKLSLIGELAAGMAHEIRNPLTTVRGLTQVLSSRFSQEELVGEHTAIMLQEIDRINTIIKELLLLSQPANPALSLASLPEELDSVCDLLEGKAHLQHVQIIKKYESNLPLAVMDTDQMKLVFLNLSLNAISAMPQGGVLSIKACYKKENGVFEIIFKDDGIGIPIQNIKKVFDPFFTTKEEGTGLGLAVSNQVVRNHGGSIFISSDTGQGTAIKIILPPLNIEQPANTKQPAEYEHSS